MGVRTQLEREFDYEIVDEFLDHFDVMTEAMEPVIIALENEGKREEKIRELFRIFHNIKSASGYLHIERINHLAALAEEVMDRLRVDPQKIDDEVIDWLLLISDQMRHWYEQILNDEEELEEIDPKSLNIPE